ncbi:MULTISPECIES: amidohydrolase family protein [Flavobacterium]|uniref:amidohydrolase family protein n=1 Tax=Flavobacterium TaxID=237 RepID=UPI001FCAB2D9|nr:MULTISPECIES: amidohydrolase family protein [Flavobacterium]UOK41528.1 amidohydrolase family protein [Flavobacterium enshiense]
MKKFLCILIILSFQIAFCQNIEADFIITNVSVVPMNTELVLKNKSVVIKNGKIIEITDDRKLKTKAKQTIDGKGKFLIPSLADAHAHLPENDVELEKYFKLNLINGVTKLRSMRGDSKHIEMKKKYNTENSYYPKLYLSPNPITKNLSFTKEQIVTFVKETKENGFDFIKVLSIKNQELFDELNAVCKEYDVKIGGHFPSNPKGVIISDESFFGSNYTSFEHLGGLIGEPNSFESRVKSIKEKKLFVCPTLQWYIISYGQYSVEDMIKQKGMQFINPETVKEWAEKTNLYREKTGKKEFEEEVALYAKELQERHAVIKRLNDEGVPLLLSPDSSSKFIVAGFAMHEEMKSYQKAGLTNYAVLKTGTVNFANLFNENYGTIEVGKNADFLIVSKNPLERLDALEKIEGIYFNNQYLNKNILEEMSRSILPN